MNKRTLCTVAVLAFAAGADAQSLRPRTYTTEIVEVVLEGCGDIPVPDAIRVVLNNREDEDFSAVHVPGSNTWRGERGTSFNGEGVVGSVRLGRGRTGCAVSSAVPRSGPWLWAAELRFRCMPGKAWQSLTLGTEKKRGAPAMPIPYVREMNGRSPCVDRSSAFLGEGTMLGVAPERERIYLNLGTPAARTPYQKYDLLIEGGELAGKSIPPSGLTVKRAQVFDPARFGRNGGNNRDAFERRLGDLGFVAITLKRKD